MDSATKISVYILIAAGMIMGSILTGATIIAVAIRSVGS
jgi:hypothetical protein